MRLHGKRAVVTGASSGIGRAVAQLLAHEGAQVVVNYRASRAAAESVVAEITARGGVATALQADVSVESDVQRLVSAAAAALGGGFEIWVNLAGADILTGASAALSDNAKLTRLIETDLRGTMLASWAATPILAAAERSCIINTSWDLALHGMAGRNPEMFAAVKAGITGFTRALARSLAPRIRVNEVAPGWIETAFATTAMADDYRQQVIDLTPLRRFGQPQDVASAVVFLASDEAAFVTGQTLMVNGGLVS